jgi:hypothetical protein
VVVDPADYDHVIAELRASPARQTSEALRRTLALKAFTHTATYDDAIAGFFRAKYAAGRQQLSLRYGTNPHQKPAQVYAPHSDLPFKGTSAQCTQCPGGAGRGHRQLTHTGYGQCWRARLATSICSTRSMRGSSSRSAACQRAQREGRGTGHGAHTNICMCARLPGLGAAPGDGSAGGCVVQARQPGGRGHCAAAVSH